MAGTCTLILAFAATGEPCDAVASFSFEQGHSLRRPLALCLLKPATAACASSACLEASPLLVAALNSVWGQSEAWKGGGKVVRYDEACYMCSHNARLDHPVPFVGVSLSDTESWLLAAEEPATRCVMAAAVFTQCLHILMACSVSGPVTPPLRVCQS